MLLNEDFSARTLVHGAAMDWVPSPAKGVTRRMLFRMGDEKARATSIVRYAPESRFARHDHCGGEEFFVLEGTFQDDTGNFPTGTYVRNPPGSGHAPRSEVGCTIFVKLWQFRADDHERVIRRPGEGKRAELRPGVSSCLVLFDSADERVMLEEWHSGAHVDLSSSAGLELLVLSGGFTTETDTLDHWSWLRLPSGMPLNAKVGPQGACVWLKCAPLLHADVCAFEDHP